MAPIYELVGSVADHMATKVENAFDSDATGYQPPVTSFPVLRLLQPMTDGLDEADFDCQDDLWQGATPVEPSQLPTGTDADEDSRLTCDCKVNTAAECCENSHQAAGAAGSSTSAATVATQKSTQSVSGFCRRTTIILCWNGSKKRKHENKVRELELSRHKNELEKQKIEIEILQIQKELKNEQICRLQCNVPPL
ncbi:hypothetical protein MRX96_006141 [Rhipicephalus microplus]